MKKSYFLVEFPVFTHTRSIQHANDVIVVEVMLEGDKEWKTAELEKAVARIADPWLYELSDGFGYGTGLIKSHLPSNEPAYASTHPDCPGVFVGAIYRQKRNKGG
jgi:hypothetical protein